MKKTLWIAPLVVLAFFTYSWRFFINQNNIFKDRQELRGKILIDSLEYRRYEKEMTNFINSSSEFKNYSLELEKIKAVNEVDRLKAELKILEWQKKEVDDFIKVTTPLAELYKSEMDSLSAVLNKTPENASAFTFIRSFNPFNGSEGEAFNYIKREALRNIKTPGTAKTASYSDNQTIVSKINNKYLVSSWLEAQNGFGAMIKSRYIGIAEKKNGKWTTLAFGFIDGIE